MRLSKKWKIRGWWTSPLFVSQFSSILFHFAVCLCSLFQETSFRFTCSYSVQNHRKVEKCCLLLGLTREACELTSASMSEWVYQSTNFCHLWTTQWPGANPNFTPMLHFRFPTRSCADNRLVIPQTSLVRPVKSCVLNFARRPLGIEGRNARAKAAGSRREAALLRRTSWYRLVPIRVH